MKTTKLQYAEDICQKAGIPFDYFTLYEVARKRSTEELFTMSKYCVLHNTEKAAKQVWAFLTRDIK